MNLHMHRVRRLIYGLLYVIILISMNAWPKYVHAMGKVRIDGRSRFLQEDGRVRPVVRPLASRSPLLGLIE